MKRIIYSAIVLISAFILPFWVTVILALIGLFLFKDFYEAIFAGLIIDSLSGSMLSFLGFDFIFTTIFIILFFVFGKIQKNLLFS